jgi:HSP20 family protein
MSRFPVKRYPSLCDFFSGDVEFPDFSDFSSDFDYMQRFVDKLSFPSLTELHSKDRFFAPSLNVPMDVTENSSCIVCTLEIPGMNPDEIKIELNDSILVISGKKILESRKESNGYCKMERRSGEFQRKVILPNNIDGDNIMAQYINGVLTIRIPKHEQPEKMGKTINIMKE